MTQSSPFTAEKIKRRLEETGNFHLFRGEKAVHFYKFKEEKNE